jgi:transcriptional regulator with GAF, ATPase, and Fis domain/CHASE2 domain-containing sensor protein
MTIQNGPRAMFKNKQVTTIFLLSLVICLVATLPSPLSRKMSNSSLDLLFKLRGQRPVSDKIVFLYIDSRDLQELHGWPITRDYYGYLTFLLHKAGARVVAFDVLFTSENQRYPEYDASFAEFIRSSRNVILPFVFRIFSPPETPKDGQFFIGSEPQYPAPLFRHHLLGTGFANLCDETIVRRTLLIATSGDTLMPSLGLECALRFMFDSSAVISAGKNRVIISDNKNRLSVPTDRHFQICLNHLGEISDLRSMSVVEAMQKLEQEPQSLDLHDKLVFVGITAPGTAPFKVTPLNAAFPASLIHLTVAENLLMRNFIRIPPLWLTPLLTLVAGLLALALFSSNGWKKTIALFAAGILYFFAAVLLFKIVYVALPLWPPLLCLLLSTLTLMWFSARQEITVKAGLRSLYDEQLQHNRQQISEAENHLNALQSQLSEQSEHSSEIHAAIAEKEAEIQRLEAYIRGLNQALIVTKPIKSDHFPQIIHAPNSKLAHVLELVAKIGLDDIPVLLIGETGSGKEEIARAIHQSGKRGRQSFVAVNCGALPETLLESELFGHEKGAFTGAIAARKGRFELADGGTLFLDEITETSAAFQAKLLRVLQEGTFEKLGSETTQRVNVRIISASSKNIPQQVQAGLFREDLFYRLNGFLLELPPLRERPEDIPLLALHFLKKHRFDEISGLSERSLELLTGYHWPGNVRELENCLRHAAILARSDGRALMQEQDLPQNIRASQTIGVYESLDEQILSSLRSLKFSHASIVQTAKALGDRDRGTITEYLRGMVFESLARCGLSVEQAAKELAATTEPKVIAKVTQKILEYIGKLSVDPQQKQSLFKGLPKKYHPYLEQVLLHLQEHGAVEG